MTLLWRLQKFYSGLTGVNRSGLLFIISIIQLCVLYFVHCLLPSARASWSCEIDAPRFCFLSTSGIGLHGLLYPPSRKTICRSLSLDLLLHTENQTGFESLDNSGLQHLTIEEGEAWGLPLRFTLMPQHFKKLGYATHMVGKWHLGYYKKEFTPTYRGFDSFFGFYNGFGDYFRHLVQKGDHIGLDLWDNEVAVRTECGNYDTDMLTDKTVSIIASHDTKKPLFLYLSHRSTHSALSSAMLQAPKKNIAKFGYIGERNRTIYAGMVDSMDAAFGRLVEALSGAGVLNNTIVVFSSDNGAVPIIEFPNRGFNWPLRGAKKTLWEGAVRVPAFVWSPLLESSGRVSDQMMHIVDWLPTFYSVAGGNLSDLGEQDGFDMWKALSEGTESPREEMLLNIDPVLNTSSLRYKNHKVVLGTYHNGSFDHRFKTTGRRRPVHDLDFLTKRSRAADVLRLLYRTDDLGFPAGWRRRATVRCGKYNLAKENVRPSSPPYLFDVVADPCELNNLAQNHPEILRELLKRLEDYAVTAVDPENVYELDARSFPEHHNGTWAPWL